MRIGIVGFGDMGGNTLSDSLEQPRESATRVGFAAGGGPVRSQPQLAGE